MTNTSPFTCFILGWTAFALVLFPLLFLVKQPYGRHFRTGWGPSVPNRAGWIIMEIPSLIIVAVFFVVSRHLTAPAAVLFSLWLIHYFNRTLVFPFRLKTEGKKMPLVIMLSGMVFNWVNASVNGFELSDTPDFERFGVSGLFRFGFGFILFVAGMAINISSDTTLIGLRKKSIPGYRIPQNGLFRWVSCPNYLGEIMEWVGFALMAWNLAALSFAVWTVVNLLPRAIDHHKWYRGYFPDYPPNRKAIIPYLL
jgi:protein-S-isoprenylcysteine O-methyltransferase Ste14